MILVDTNVISELARNTPDENVLQWLDAQPGHEIGTTAVTAAELWCGISRLADGARKQELAEVIDAILNKDLQQRIASFDAQAAREYANVVSARDRLGKPISTADGQIVAICLAQEATLATRNTKDFADTGVRLIDPWRHQ